MTTDHNPTTTFSGTVLTELEMLRISIDAQHAKDEAIRQDAFAALKRRADTRLNAYLVGLEPGCDDSIYGFNEAWDIVRKAFNEVMRKE